MRVSWSTETKPQQSHSLYYSLGIHHYSNGQDESGTTADGSVNTKNGTFNTNYMELAAHFLQNKREKQEDEPALKWAQIALRQHFYGTFEQYQHDQYPRRQLTLGLHSKDFEFMHFGSVQLRLTETMGSGYRYVVKNDVTPNRNIEARIGDRFNTRLEMLTRATVIDELRFYMRYDYGYDYYNIAFQQRINRFQIGLAALSR